MDDWSRHQMGKIRDEQAVAREVALALAVPVDVGQERDLGESIEGDADRQRDVDVTRCEVKQRGQVIQREVGVFEEGEQPEIEHQRENEHCLAARCCEIEVDQCPTGQVVDQDRDRQDRRLGRIAPGIEHHRADQQDRQQQLSQAESEREMKCGQDDREEPEEKFSGDEKHVVPCLRRVS